MSQPTSSAFARLLRELASSSGEDLERALAESAPLFARLGARAAPRILGTPHLPPAWFTEERALRELVRLTLRELLRLCELAAQSEESPLERGGTQLDLAELLAEELACARGLHALPRALERRLRDCAKLLHLGVCPSSELQACAADLRARLESA